MMSFCQLSSWLNQMEEQINTWGSVGTDLDTVAKQVDKHKDLQTELEKQQEHVNNLQNMVVVVDESATESCEHNLSFSSGSSFEENSMTWFALKYERLPIAEIFECQGLRAVIWRPGPWRPFYIRDYSKFTSGVPWGALKHLENIGV